MDNVTPTPEQVKTYTIEYRFTQDHQDPSKVFLKHQMGQDIFYCELEIKEFQ